MDWKILGAVFVSVFIAEMGDKTQLATMLFASDKEVSKWTIFLGASLALIAASGIGVMVAAPCRTTSTKGICTTLLERVLSLSVSGRCGRFDGPLLFCHPHLL